ncbi:16S rRNA (guanine(527)-N(7))-methyltransferase RsmG [Wenjunlia vitaminophila]|uniref:Ribosomal RNA small subunit methyltransferase G n=1 Tax=Wenjunlia vitaminophila TaxID=76728 RepID=A0A0T6LMF9_WENVI|nr:16S rRNA (guanine(527)-N(7))-methyltransferase RsmG [Wenjunlia vitaminophila]KRV47315.1 16S rRNA (guanine(527)-N(7))-methyltransferase RsmG [Wenjunlia vitaminophila]
MVEAARVPAAPDEAHTVFGEHFSQAVRYAELLADIGVGRGLIGPREVPRLWERHLINCAVLGEVVPEGVSVCDVGSGAGLPGIPLALTRPDLRITLLEPLLRRTIFLQETVEELGLDNVTVVRGRAEEVAGKLPPVDVVTARAVAPLERLAGWGLPLLRPRGEMLALKGETAQEELTSARDVLHKLGAVEWSVVRVGAEVSETPATVIRVLVGESPGGVRAGARRAKAVRASRAARGGGGRRRR